MAGRNTPSDPQSKKSLTNPEWENDPGSTAGDHEQSSPVRTSILALFLLALLAGGIWFLIGNSSTESNASTSPEPVSTTDNLPVLDTNLYDLPPLTVAKNFALADTIDERLKWARNPELIKERLSQYPDNARTYPATRVIPIGNTQLNDIQYVTFFAELSNGSRRLLCVVGTPDGPRVDWDAYARYGTASWNDILAGKVTKATVRIFPQPSTYYTKNFQDREQWTAYALASPDLDLPLYGYVKNNTPLHQKFLKAQLSGARRAIVDLTITPEDSAHRQVEITALKTLGWVEPDLLSSESR